MRSSSLSHSIVVVVICFLFASCFVRSLEDYKRGHGICEYFIGSPPKISVAVVIARASQEIISEDKVFDTQLRPGVCYGTSNGLDHTKAFRIRYDQYRAMYTNCTYVEGNLEIVFLNGGSENETFDLDFLSQIQEVTGYVLIVANSIINLHLDELRIIRGEVLYTGTVDDDQVQPSLPTHDVTATSSKPALADNQYSLYIALNYKPDSTSAGLEELRLTSLREIMNGHVLITENNLLCFEKTVNWNDILTGPGAHVRFTSPTGSVNLHYKRQCPSCHPSCNGHCWGQGPNMCQTLTRIHCPVQCDGRCYGNRTATDCCSTECAGGCKGGTSSDCLGCKHYTDDGRCVTSCPPLVLYGTDHVIRDNPKGKYLYSRQCVKQCPPNYIARKDVGACVSDCGLGRHVGVDGTCADDTRCTGGYCPKKCYLKGAAFITANETEGLVNCTVIVGGLRIQINTFEGDSYNKVPGMTPSQLEVLKTVEEITDFLLVDADNDDLRDLSFLSNLRAIHGRHLEPPERAVLKIHKTKLTSLGLNSLNKIGNGNIRIEDNSELCYVSSVNWTALRTTGNRGRVRIDRNKNITNCQRQKHVCSVECSDDGCWGPLDSQCIRCKHYRHEQRCVSNCSTHVGLYVINATSECGQCHEECTRTTSACTGPGPDQCKSCRHGLLDKTCVAQCPTSHYLDSHGVCQKCHPHCTGCTGPSNGIGTGRCSDCSLVQLEPGNGAGPSRVAQCLEPTLKRCPEGFYEKSIDLELVRLNRSLNAKTATTEFRRACAPCDRECSRCHGPGPQSCDVHCRNFVEENRCVAKCSAEHYSLMDPSTPTVRHCMPCHKDCLSCVGPLPSACIDCKVYTVYDDFDDRFDADAAFNCTDTCPVGAGYKLHDNGRTICAPDSYDMEHRRMVTIISATLVSCVFLICIAVVAYIVCKRYIARSREQSLRFTAKLNGVLECEPLTPGNAQPDMAVLRLIKESDIRRGDVIGSGAFGTVYKGYWIPEGENVKIPVAIKVLQDSTQNQGILDEARIMASVIHPCCLHLLAVCLTSQVLLITQLMQHGCLLDYVRKNRSNIGSKSLLNWSTQIARGMAYLESRNIIHRDLAARNVLVHNANHVKITDFGLAKLVSGNEALKTESCRMPIKWMALESIRNRNYSHKSDVWSFGVTVWELFTYGQRPYEAVRAQDIVVLLEKGERLPQPAICTIDVYMIMIKCWMLEADSRPTFNELVEEFAKMARDPGRYLVIANDELLRLPSQTSTDPSFTWVDPDEGPENIVLADDYVNQKHRNNNTRRSLQQRIRNQQTSSVRRQETSFSSGDAHNNHNHHLSPASPLLTADDDETTSTTYSRSSLSTYTTGTTLIDTPDRRPASGYLVTPPATAGSNNRTHYAEIVGSTLRLIDTPDRKVYLPVDGTPAALQAGDIDTPDRRSGDVNFKTTYRSTDLRLPLDSTDYLQPQSSAPATYLEITDGYETPQNNASCMNEQQSDSVTSQQAAVDVSAVNNPEYFT